MTILVTGAAGQLGSEVVSTLRRRGDRVIEADLGDFDLQDAEAVHAFVQTHQPEALIHCGGYSDVNKAETAPEDCISVNAMGTLNLVREALKVDASLMLVSSDLVFDGEKGSPYETADPVGPVNVFGLSKLQAEEAVRCLMTRYYIVRTSGLFSRHGIGFLHGMYHVAEGKAIVYAPEDRLLNPTYTVDLAETMAELIHSGSYGVYHAANAGGCSVYAFVRELLREMRSPRRVEAVQLSDLRNLATYPRDTRISMASLEAAGLSPLPDWRNALARLLRETGLSASHLDPAEAVREEEERELE